jgi:general secretion pathway protein A
LLTNLETNTRKLLKIFLIGQPELQTLLARPEMRQVAQRVVARYHLTQLGASEVKCYVSHRLSVSGADPDIFPDSLMRPIFRASGGVPRLINLICDRAMLGTYVNGLRHVTAPILLQAVKEVFEARQPRRYRWLASSIAAGIAALAGALVVGATGFPDVASGWLPRQIDAPVASPEPTPMPVPVHLETISPEQALAILMPGTELSPKLTAVAVASESSSITIDPLVWPQGASSARGEVLAFQSLFKMHGLNFDVNSGVDPCRQAEASGLRCYSGRGGLSELLLLDHPVVVRLLIDRHEYSATLVGLDQKHNLANLLIAGEERHIVLAELANSWSGKYVLLWHAPGGFRDALLVNHRGPAIAWLRQAMARVDGHTDDGSDYFDTALAQRVRAFQLSEGIQPDGVVGPRTAIRLNLRSGENGPRLVMAEKG